MIEDGGLIVADASVTIAIIRELILDTLAYLAEGVVFVFLAEAIDLVDEAASALRLQQESKPDAIQELDRQIMTIQIELESLRKESDIASKERREQLDKSLTLKQDEVGALTEKWEKERAEIDEIKKTKEQLESARLELDQAQREGNFAKASELRYAKIPELQKKLPLVFFSFIIASSLMRSRINYNQKLLRTLLFFFIIILNVD